MQDFRNRLFWVCFLIGIVAFTLSNGSWNVPIMAWVFPICFLYITRYTTPVRGSLLLLVLIILGGMFRNQAALEQGFPTDIIGGAIMSIIIVVPFVIDRIFWPMFTKDGSIWRRFAGTLIFPASVAVFEIALSYLHLGAFDSIALTQGENMTLVQIASIAGQPGIAFLVCWASSGLYFFLSYLVNENTKSVRDLWYLLRKPLIIAFAIILFVGLYGGGRLAFQNSDEIVTKIAIANGPEQIIESSKWISADYETNVDSLNKSVEEATGGNAKVLVYNEAAFCIPYQKENDFRNLVCQKAKEKGIYIEESLELEDLPSGRKSELREILVSPDGEELHSYTKSSLIPVFETGQYIEGDGNIPSNNMFLTNNGASKVSVVIGFEGDMGGYINDIPKDTDFLFVPSMEWKGLGTIHASSMQVRAVEHGVNIIEPTCDNTGGIYNYYGRPLLLADPSETGYDAVNFAYVPTSGNVTIYASLGPAINMAYIAGLVILIALSIKHRRDTKGNKTNVK